MVVSMDRVNTYSCGLNEVIINGLRADLDKYLREREVMKVDIIRYKKKIEELEKTIEEKDRKMNLYVEQLKYCKKFNPYFKYEDWMLDEN